MISAVNIKTIISSLVLLLLLPGFVEAQILDYTQFLTRDRDDDRRAARRDDARDRPATLIEALHRETVLDGYINPDEYILGPMDLLSVHILGEFQFGGEVLVMPEGSILIATVGEVAVNGLTLTDAKEKIKSAIKAMYKTEELSVALLSPRAFTVHVSGMVERPGSHPVLAVHRASNAIQQAGVFDGDREHALVSRGVDAVKVRSSLRNIKLYRSNGEILPVDLIRYYITGDNKYNPRLHDGDIIVVPPEDITANSISIQGGIRLPGRYEYKEGDDLNLILRLAQGFTENAVRDSIEIVRFLGDGKQVEYLYADADKILNDEKIFPLERNDRIFVRQRPDVRRENTVTVRGEVNLNGNFSITRENTKLSEVIAWAGGFTPYAALSEAVVLRRSPGGGEGGEGVAGVDPNKLRRLSPMKTEEANYFNYEMQLLRNTVAVDFRKLFVENDGSADITLRSGDVIIVPSKMNTVFVFGQVVSPGHITHVQGMGLDYYLHRAGGTSDVARERGMMVIKAGTNEWVKPDETNIEPGDAIWVPRKPERGVGFYFASLRDVLQLTTTLATLYLIILQISDK